MVFKKGSLRFKVKLILYKYMSPKNVPNLEQGNKGQVNKGQVNKGQVKNINWDKNS